MTKRITAFHGEYDFLSNFYLAPITINGWQFKTNEHAYQFAKTFNPEHQQEILACPTPAAVKKLGRKVALRPDWPYVKLDLMELIVHTKFTQHPDLARKLVATGNAELIEGNYWNDTFWGVCRGVGENHLGKILMKIREEMRQIYGTTS